MTLLGDYEDDPERYRAGMRSTKAHSEHCFDAVTVLNVLYHLPDLPTPLTITKHGALLVGTA